MTSIRRQEDRTPPPGIPTFRITVELPAAWQSYIANNVTDAFDDMEPDDPWNRAAANREAARLEKEGYALLGPVIEAEAEFGRHEGTLGAITTYEAVNHGVLDGDDAAGMWRFRPAGSETEYLILPDAEGVVWLPEHWRRKLADPLYEIDECDIEWPDPAGDDPAHPPSRVSARCRETVIQATAPRPRRTSRSGTTTRTSALPGRSPRAVGPSTRPSTAPASVGSSVSGDRFARTS